MKHILKFDKYNLIKEADEVDPALDTPAPSTEAPAPEQLPADNQQVATDSATPEPTEPEVPKRNSAVVLKEFLEELRGHLIYWFKFGKISDILTAKNRDITKERRGLCIWAEDVEQEYMWKIKFLESEIQGKIEQVEKLLLSIDVYDYDRENLLKQKEIIIPIDKMNEDYLMKTIKEIKKSILKVPSKISDVKKFKEGEKDSLTDDIY